jgi:import inner membrane translocase subunit TIM50
MKKLLPTVEIHPMFPTPKTLVLNLSGTLVHTEFVFGKGAELVRRPYLGKFLEQMAQQYEVVIFTDDDMMFTLNISAKLDPENSIFSGKFCREAMVMTRKGYVKDLSYLNRDLAKVVVIDKSLDMLPQHGDNAILLPEYRGEAGDTQLSELVPLLKYLANPKVKDVREELRRFGDNPVRGFN